MFATESVSNWTSVTCSVTRAFSMGEALRSTPHVGVSKVTVHAHAGRRTVPLHASCVGPTWCRVARVYWCCANSSSGWKMHFSCGTFNQSIMQYNLSINQHRGIQLNQIQGLGSLVNWMLLHIMHIQTACGVLSMHELVHHPGFG